MNLPKSNNTLLLTLHGKITMDFLSYINEEKHDMNHSLSNNF